MSDDTRPQNNQDSSGEQEQESPPKPDPNVEAPDFPWVNEAYERDRKRPPKVPTPDRDVKKTSDPPD